MTVRGYQGLEVWKMSMELVAECYQVTIGFPKDERCGLTAQLRRAAISVPSNMAEGQGRQHTREFIQFIGIAGGAELETQLQIAVLLGYISDETAAPLLSCTASIARMLRALRSSLAVRAGSVQAN